MRVNVSKVFISKTFMSGLKVSFNKQQKQKQNQLQQRQLTKSNNKSLEFYLKLVKIFTKNPLATRQQQDLVVALIILKEFATFASKTTTTIIIIIPLLILVQYIIISFNVFSRLTVLMNDFRLKTFYCKSSKTTKNKFYKNKTLKSNKNNNKKTATSISSISPSFNKKPHNSRFLLTNSIINLKISSTLSTPTFSSTAGGAAAAASASAVAFATSATLLLQQTSSKNNNHHRTYNNSSKSNKVFLYYTPRDPRLRIFLKTKHLFNRPQQHQQPQLINTIKNIHNSNNSCCIKSVKSLLSDLCNYGELIGGSKPKSGEYKNNFSENNHKTIVKQLNSVNFNLNKPKKDNCDNLKSDNLIIVATAGAANETISANILFVIFSVAVLSEYTQELLRTIEILVSYHTYHHQQLNIINEKSTFRLHDSIL